MNIVLASSAVKSCGRSLASQQLKIPEHVVRTKAQLLLVLVIQLRSLAEAVEELQRRG